MIDIRPGAPHTLGAHLEADGTNVAIRAPEAEGVTLSLFDSGDVRAAERQVELPGSIDGIWHGKVTGLRAGQHYGYRIRRDGVVSDPLLDPYARRVSGDLADPARPVRGIIVDEGFDWRGDHAPRIPWERTVVYEAHVKGVTMCHPDVPESLRGRYLGLSHPAVIEHLQALGVTAVELLPVHQFVTEPSVSDRGLTNYWGYNTAAFFAPHHAYAADDPVTEFKQMVRELHAAGLEVILDVVYNHTAEGGPQGPTFSWRGLDERGYYRHADDGGYWDCTGCGNTVRSDDPHAARMITESLRYWIKQMHVDGFRFDLASALTRNGHHDVDLSASLIAELGADPVISTVKLIAEPWDASASGYLVGAYPPPWSEWNDRFRDGVRDFWRATPGGVRDLARRLAGSADLFDHDGRGVRSSINFVTSHDGFTLRDVVSYDHKHNEANGEDNRDGHDDNRSWNSGAEGQTDDPGVLAVRRRQAANLAATLTLAAGVPMLLAGDELGRTQGGNNNGYCHDDPTTWLDWTEAVQDREWDQLRPLLTRLLELRREHPAFAEAGFRHGHVDDETGRRNLAWFHPRGLEMTDRDWNDEHLNSVGMYLDGGAEHPGLLILLHAGPAPVTWTLPGSPWAGEYALVADTAAEVMVGDSGDPPRLAPGAGMELAPHTLRVYLTSGR